MLLDPTPRSQPVFGALLSPVLPIIHACCSCCCCCCWCDCAARSPGSWPNACPKERGGLLECPENPCGASATAPHPLPQSSSSLLLQDCPTHAGFCRQAGCSEPVEAASGALVCLHQAVGFLSCWLLLILLPYMFGRQTGGEMRDWKGAGALEPAPLSLLAVLPPRLGE
eukprot:585203-Pelagomonas_calceolata.AAC.5